MTEKLINSLLLYETDVDGALKRLSGNEELYAMILKGFLADDTMSVIETAINEKRWDDAFTAAHALKGLAGNLGFIPLYHSLGSLVIDIRSAKMVSMLENLSLVKNCYLNIVKVIKNNID